MCFWKFTRCLLDFGKQFHNLEITDERKDSNEAQHCSNKWVGVDIHPDETVADGDQHECTYCLSSWAKVPGDVGKFPMN